MQPDETNYLQGLPCRSDKRFPMNLTTIRHYEKRSMMPMPVSFVLSMVIKAGIAS